MTVIPNPPSVGEEFTNDTTGVTYKYDGTKWVIISTPGSEGQQQISDDLLALTSRVSTGEGIQEQIQETVEDALVTQSDIQGDIDVLEAKVDALEATVIDGKWQMDVRSVAGAGKFVVLGLGGNATEWADVIKLQMNPISYDGKSYTFAEVSVEDVVRIGYPGSSASFKVTSPFVQSGDVYEATVELLVSESQPFGSVIYDFEFLPSFDPSAYATVDYVDNVADTKVNLTGDNEVTTAWRIKTQNKSFISVTANEMKLYHIADPTGQDNGWAANKGYVDTEVGKVDAKIDTAVEPLASKEYVDDRIPPSYGSPYKYRNTDTTAENLQPGEFFIASNNAYFHPFDQKGRELVTTAHHNHSTDVAGIFKVYDGTGKLVHQMAFNQYSTGNTDNNYCKLFVNHTMRTKSSWSSTYTYYLADGFLLPY